MFRKILTHDTWSLELTGVQSIWRLSGTGVDVDAGFFEECFEKMVSKLREWPCELRSVHHSRMPESHQKSLYHHGFLGMLCWCLPRNRSTLNRTSHSTFWIFMQIPLAGIIEWLHSSSWRVLSMVRIASNNWMKDYQLNIFLLVYSFWKLVKDVLSEYWWCWNRSYSWS